MKGNVLVSLETDLVEKVKAQVEPRGFSKLVGELLEAWYNVEVVNSNIYQKSNIQALEEEEKKIVANLTKIKREINIKNSEINKEKKKQREKLDKLDNNENNTKQNYSNLNKQKIEYKGKFYENMQEVLEIMEKEEKVDETNN